MIQAIIFDCFGVLATEGWLPFKEQYFGHDPVKNQQAGDLMEQANSGFMNPTDFVAAIAELADIDAASVKSALRHNVPNQPLFDYIEQLKPHYKLGILSNSALNRLHDIFTETQLALFDSIILSFETKLTKPDPKIYELAADKLGVEPSNCVFIDDQEWLVTAASDLGMHGIVYQDSRQLRSELEQLLAK